MPIQQLEGPVDTFTKGFLAGQKIQSNLSALRTQALQNQLLAKQVSGFEEMRALERQLLQNQILTSEERRLSLESARGIAEQIGPLEIERVRTQTEEAEKTGAAQRGLTKVQTQKAEQDLKTQFIERAATAIGGDQEIEPGEIEAYVSANLHQIAHLYPVPIVEGDTTYQSIVTAVRSNAEVLSDKLEQERDANVALTRWRNAQASHYEGGGWYGVGGRTRRTYLTPAQEAQVNLLGGDYDSTTKLLNEYRAILQDPGKTIYMEDEQKVELRNLITELMDRKKEIREEIEEITGPVGSTSEQHSPIWSQEQLDRAQRLLDEGRVLDARYDPSSGRMLYEVPDPLEGTAWVFEENIP